jgi:hypothetical protein
MDSLKVSNTAEAQSQQRRQRLDSVLHGILDEGRTYKRMRADGQRWKKISQIINKPDTQLLLFEVPKDVSTQVHT